MLSGDDRATDDEDEDYRYSYGLISEGRKKTAKRKPRPNHSTLPPTRPSS